MKKEERELDYIDDTDLDTNASDDYPLPETDNKRWELDEEPILASLRYELKKRVNRRGVDDLMGWFRIGLNKTSALTNLTDPEINDFLKYEIDALIEEFRSNNKRWGYPTSAAKTAIVRWVYSSMKKQLKRAFNDGERKYRKESYGYNENYNHNEVRNEEIGSGFRLWPFGRKKNKNRFQDNEEERF